jgi:phosphatidylglycerophosphatase A
MLVGVLAVWFEIYDIVKKNTINWTNKYYW